MLTMRGQAPLSVLSSLAFSTLAIAAVPADPTITAPAILPRQNNDRFIGFVSFSGSWYSETCNVGLTWYQDGKYGQCCPATLARCYAPTACVSGSLIYPYSDRSSTTTIACTNNYDNTAYSVCNTAFIFENMNDSSPKTDIVCGESSVNWSYYRSIPASATAVSSQAPTNIPQPSPTPKPKDGDSKAWIAGAVVGPIVGLALIGGLVWFLLRRRNRKQSQTGGAAMASTDPTQPPPGVGGYTDAKPQFPPQQQSYTADPYAQQGAFAGSQNRYSEVPISPAPQYNAGPGNPPGAEYYGADGKNGYAGAPLNGAAELGGETSGTVPAAPAPVQHQAAELGGESRHDGGGGAGLFGGNAELQNNAQGQKNT